MEDAALLAAVDALRGGEIVALKGVGGFHLACDARSSAAILRLRRREAREGKPFALLERDVTAIAPYVEVSAEEGGYGIETLSTKPQRFHGRQNTTYAIKKIRTNP